jgi:hypothetical protein
MQRIIRYPVLLARLNELTPPQDGNREEILWAQRMVEARLQTINSVTQSDSFEITGRRIFVSACIYTLTGK